VQVSLGGQFRAVTRSLVCLAFLLVAVSAGAGEMEDAQNIFLSGDYARVVELASNDVAERPYSEEWQILLSESLLALGRYPEAQTVVSNSLARGYPSPRLRWVARRVLLANGRKEEADDMVNRILESAANGRISDAESLVALGRAALVKGVEPKLVLDRMFTPAKKEEPNAREVYLAIGGLALEKHDFALAAKNFQEGLKRLPDDPDLLQGLAQAYEPNHQSLMIETLETALKRNSNHVASLLLLTDHAIDAEDYAAATDFLDHIQQINPWSPEAWAYRAVIAIIQNKPQEAKAAREKALKFWPANPRVPYLVGLKLSQKYRFVEGAELQREALKFDPKDLEAKVQLAQDLLRLGEEADGWRLADEVQKADSYNVTANNLMSLHDGMQSFTLLTNEHCGLRMTPREASLYGGRALELLKQAREKLSVRYGCAPEKTTLVEVFTNQADFGVRTFALPQNDGFLGVCFGNVITANSPGAYAGHRFNWEAMLWHEFCHVITLNLTHNKMPRWLSEGISVYEERQANPAWGEHITPTYREMILEGELTPIGKLSAAFLMPPSAEHLQFAYYESSLVVQFIIERFGFPKLQAILHDLGEGAEINETIAKHTVAMEALDKEFEAYAIKVAHAMGPGLDWERPSPARRAVAQRNKDETSPPSPSPPPDESPRQNIRVNNFDWESWAKTHPTNFYAMTARAQQLIDKEDWPGAKAILTNLLELCPDNVGSQSAYAMLAETYRALSQTNEERKVLERFAERDERSIDAYARLMELDHMTQDWKSVTVNAVRYRAVNPLVPVPYRFLAEGAEKTGDTHSAIEARRALLELDPPDPAEAHFRLARLLYQVGDPAAKRQVLQALEEAPRYREALALLLEMNKKETTSPGGSSGGTPE
jgi:tetratricopeptide (TPR) repeat protein